VTGTLNYSAVFDLEQLSNLPIHPLATIYRPIDSVSFELLKTAMAEHGQQSDVSLWRGALVDGRARIVAARELGWHYLLVNLLDDMQPVDLIEHAWKLNYNDPAAHRFSHTIGQRAMAAYRLYRAMREPANKQYPVPRLEQKDMGQRLGVGNGSITRAGVIYRHGSKEDIEAVDSGEAQVATVSRYVRSEVKNTPLENFKARHSLTRSANMVRGNAISTIGTMGIVLKEHGNAPLPSPEVAEQWLTELEGTLQWLTDLRDKILNGRGGQ